MGIRQQEHTDSRHTSIPETIAKVSFVVYLFFVLFGTTMPFQEEIRDLDDIVTSNVVNQIVLTIVFLLSSFSLVHKGKELVLLIKKEKFMTLFLVWCLVSVLWSEFRFESLKGVFRLFITATVGLALLLHCDSIDRPMKYFMLVLGFYVPLSLISILVIPGAVHADDFGWRGLASHKNLLGQSMLVSSLVWFWAIRQSWHGRKLLPILMFSASVVLLIGSKSITSIGTGGFLAALGMLWSIDNKFKTLGIGRAFSGIVIVAALGMLVSVYYVAPEVMSVAPSSVGKDVTFTGRTEIWVDILGEARKHVVLGSGFAGFWVPRSRTMLYLYDDYGWPLTDAHNGYLDVLNEVGMVGLTLLFLMVVFYVGNIWADRRSYLWTWMISSVLIVNLTESTLFGDTATGVVFTVSYLAAYVGLIHEYRKREDDRIEHRM